jgi:hypothetical protein
MKKQEIKLKEDIKVFEDKKTKAKTIAIPFKLIDNTPSVIMICKLKNNTNWEPYKQIKKITIEYYENIPN